MLYASIVDIVGFPRVFGEEIPIFYVPLENLLSQLQNRVLEPDDEVDKDFILVLCYLVFLPCCPKCL